MEKAKFTLRVPVDKLKEMKILAIKKGIPLNELLINAFDLYENINKYSDSEIE